VCDRCGAIFCLSPPEVFPGAGFFFVGRRPSAGSGMFYNWPRCSAVVPGNLGLRCKTLVVEVARVPGDYRFFCICENDFLSQALPCQMVSDAKRAYEAVIRSGIPSDNVRNSHDE
jgi:hypothetical protein